MTALVVGEDGALPLPWLNAPLADTLARQRGHALLLHGAEGIGTLPFAIVLAQALLCEGRAGSCSSTCIPTSSCCCPKRCARP